MAAPLTELLQKLHSHDASIHEKLQYAERLARALKESVSLTQSDSTIPTTLKARLVSSLLDWLYSHASKKCSPIFSKSKTPPGKENASLSWSQWQETWGLFSVVLTLSAVSPRHHLPANLLINMGEALKIESEMMETISEPSMQSTTGDKSLCTSISCILHLLATKFRSSHKPALEPTATILRRSLERYLSSMQPKDKEYHVHHPLAAGCKGQVMEEWNLAATAANLFVLVLRSQPNPRKKWDSIVPNLVPSLLYAAFLDSSIDQIPKNRSKTTHEMVAGIGCREDHALEVACRVILEEALLDTYHLPFLAESAKSFDEILHSDQEKETRGPSGEKKDASHSLYVNQLFDIFRKVMDSLQSSCDSDNRSRNQRFEAVVHGLPWFVHKYCDALQRYKSSKLVSISLSGKMSAHLDSKKNELKDKSSLNIPHNDISIDVANHEYDSPLRKMLPVPLDSDFNLFSMLARMLHARLVRRRNGHAAEWLLSLAKLCECLRTCSIYRPTEDSAGVQRRALESLAHVAFDMISKLTDGASHQNRRSGEEAKSVIGSSFHLIRAILASEHRVLETYLISLWPYLWATIDAAPYLDSIRFESGCDDERPSNAQDVSAKEESLQELHILATDQYQEVSRGCRRKQRLSEIAADLVCELIDVYAELRQLTVLLSSLADSAMQSAATAESARLEDRSCGPLDLVVHPRFAKHLGNALRSIPSGQVVSVVEFVTKCIASSFHQHNTQSQSLVNEGQYQFSAQLGLLCLDLIPIDLMTAARVSDSIKKLLDALQEPIRDFFENLITVAGHHPHCALWASSASHMNRDRHEHALKGRRKLEKVDMSLHTGKFAGALQLYAAALDVHHQCCLLNPAILPLLGQATETNLLFNDAHDGERYDGTYFDALSSDRKGFFVNIDGERQRLIVGSWLYQAFWRIQQEPELFGRSLRDVVRTSALHRFMTLHLRRLSMVARCYRQDEDVSESVEAEENQMWKQLCEKEIRMILSSLKLSEDDFVELKRKYRPSNRIDDTGRGHEQEQDDVAGTLQASPRNKLCVPHSELMAWIQPTILSAMLHYVSLLEDPLSLEEDIWKLLLEYHAYIPSQVTNAARHVSRFRAYVLANASSLVGSRCRSLYEDYRHLHVLLEKSTQSTQTRIRDMENILDIAGHSLAWKHTKSKKKSKDVQKVMKKYQRILKTMNFSLKNISDAESVSEAPNLDADQRRICTIHEEPITGIQIDTTSMHDDEKTLRSENAFTSLDANLKMLIETISFFVDLNIRCEEDSLRNIVALMYVGLIVMSVSLSLGVVLHPFLSLTAMQCAGKASTLVSHCARAFCAASDRSDSKFPSGFLDGMVVQMDAVFVLWAQYGKLNQRGAMEPAFVEITTSLKDIVKSHLMTAAGGGFDNCHAGDNVAREIAICSPETSERSEDRSKAVIREYKSIVKSSTTSIGHLVLAEAALAASLSCVEAWSERQEGLASPFPFASEAKRPEDTAWTGSIDIPLVVVSYGDRYLPALKEVSGEGDSVHVEERWQLYSASSAHVLSVLSLAPSNFIEQYSLGSSRLVSRLAEDVETVMCMLHATMVQPPLLDVEEHCRQGMGDAEDESSAAASLLGKKKATKLGSVSRNESSNDAARKCTNYVKYIRAVAAIISQMKPPASDLQYGSIVALVLHILRLIHVDYTNVDPRRRNWPFASIFPAAQGTFRDARAEALSAIGILFSQSTNRQLHWMLRFTDSIINGLKSALFASSETQAHDVNLVYLLPACEMALMAMEACTRKASLESFWERLTLPADIALITADCTNILEEIRRNAALSSCALASSFEALKLSIMSSCPSHREAMKASGAVTAIEQGDGKRRKLDLVRSQSLRKNSSQDMGGNDGRESKAPATPTWKSYSVPTPTCFEAELMISFATALRCLESIAARPKLFVLSDQPWWSWALHRTLASLSEVWESSRIPLKKRNKASSALAFVNDCRLLLALMRHREADLANCMPLVACNISSLMMMLSRWEMLGQEGTERRRTTSTVDCSFPSHSDTCAKELADVMEGFSRLHQARMYSAHLLGDYLICVASPMSSTAWERITKDFTIASNTYEDVHWLRPEVGAPEPRNNFPHHQKQQKDEHKQLQEDNEQDVVGTVGFEGRTILRPSTLEVLQQGAFALYDVCDSSELQYLYSLIRSKRGRDRTVWTAALEDLKSGYERLYKYTGKI